MWSWGRLEITWGFPLLAALVLLVGPGEALPQVVLAAAGHELGHLAALGLMGAPVQRLRLTAFGLELQADTRRLSYGREMLCTLAGPGVNLLAALLLARGLGCCYALAGANLVLGVFNLLPVQALDGGRALWLGVSYLAEPVTADRVCRRVGLACAVGLVALAAVLVAVHHTGLFLLLAAVGTLPPGRGRSCLTGDREQWYISS